MFRRAAALVFSFMLVLGSFSCASAASPEAQMVYRSRTPLQYAIAPGGVFLYTDGTLQWFAESAFDPVGIREDAAIVQLAADSMVSGVWCLSEDPSGQALTFVSTDGLVIDQAHIPAGETIVQLESSASPFILDEGGRICSFYAPDASRMPLSFDPWVNADVTLFALWEDHLAAYKGGTGELTLLDRAKQAPAFPAMTVPGLAEVLIGSAEEGILLGLLENGQMIRICLAQGTQEPLDVRLPADRASLGRNSHALYALCDSGRTLYSLPLSDLLGRPMRTTLTLVNVPEGEAHFQAAVDLFSKKYPDVQIVTRNIDDYRIIVTEMMGGQEGIDIVTLQDSMMPTSSALLLKSGALMDLNQFEALTSLRDAYRDIFDPLTIDGHWYALPAHFDQHPWRVNEALAAQIGWEIPAGRWSWADFLALAEKVKTWNETAEDPIYLLQEDNFLFPYFFHEFQANHMDIFSGKAEYQSQAYIDLLNMWKQLSDDGLICTSLTSLNPTMRRNALLHAYRTNLPSMGHARYICPPTETEDARYPVYAISCLALNANTPHLEEAVHFLACWLAPETASRRYYWNDGQLLRDKSLYSLDMDCGSGISAENEALWNDMLTKGAPELYLYDISRQQHNTLLPALLSGKITAEEFAAISQQLADMALGE